MKLFFKKIIFLLAFVGCAATAQAQIVNIPDMGFKNMLTSGVCVDADGDGTLDSDADTNNDGEIQVSEAEAVSVLAVSGNGMNITNLTGIQAFINLRNLSCGRNEITALNLQGLVHLEYLYCGTNLLNSLNVQGLTNLQHLICSENNLTNLDVQGLVSLEYLYCGRNMIGNLNALGLTNLKFLDCYDNRITNLNVQGLMNLQTLNCNYNLLSSLNLQGLTSLKEVYCINNNLTSLIVQGLISLEGLGCQNNALTNLDVQGLTSLQGLGCDNNALTNLDVQGLTSLQFLSCGNNHIPTLNVQGLTNLLELTCEANQITSLSVQGLTNLQRFYCYSNHLTTLNVQGLNSLKYLTCGNSSLSCLSFLPNSLLDLGIVGSSITCLPNIPPSIQTTLPLCTPNNPNGCLFAARLFGKAYQDFNGNCATDANDILQKNILIEAKNTATQEVYYTNSDANGLYELGLPAPATYTLKAVFQNNYWATCAAQTITLTQNLDEVQQDVFIQPLVQCADMEIDHQLQNLARPCSTAVYRVAYLNSGTIAAAGAFAKLTLPAELTLQTISRPYTALGGGVYEVQLPVCAALNRDTFSFSAQVSCSAVMNQMLCTEVEVLPHTFCNAGLSGWDGSDIEVSGRCVGQDSVRFIITNTGNGGMSTGRAFGVIEDNVMIRGNTFQLAAGASDSITVAADPHKIYRMIADEDPNNPSGNTQETFMVWGCNGINNQIHWGFVNQFGLNNGSINPHRLCTPVRTSFDPNDIAATPEGTGTEHFILKNTDLEYKIRFQNTGNDTAFVVRIIDKIPAELDLTTLRIGTSSHAMTYSLKANGTLEFLFQNIRLEDSTSNEAKSHGFLTYKIKTKPNIATGSIINNQAFIYFDANAPVATNIYTHTIGENLSQVFTSTVQVIDNQTFSVKIMPNPMGDFTEIRINPLTPEGGNGSLRPFEGLGFTLYNTLGQTVKTQSFAGDQLLLQRDNLPQGCYFYKITDNGKLMAQGRIVMN